MVCRYFHHIYILKHAFAFFHSVLICFSAVSVFGCMSLLNLLLFFPIAKTLVSKHCIRTFRFFAVVPFPFQCFRWIQFYLVLFNFILFHSTLSTLNVVQIIHFVLWFFFLYLSFCRQILFLLWCTVVFVPASSMLSFICHTS